MAADLFQKKISRLRRRNWFLRLCISLVITLTVVYLLFGVIFGIAVVNGESMTPTLHQEDFVFFLRICNSYERGDIILLETENDVEYIKRVAGVPGQTIDVDKITNELLINGEKLSEPYIYDDVTLAGYELTYPLTLHENEYFYLGDNRTNSIDSRDKGPADVSNIDGKVLFVFKRQRTYN